ncbi:829_t:CDS:2 [Paraglomus occultum]|uniref:829_t:CDS:1 n=1 Tax=Paraglomus occultum TaxID=144539 RepID=A0A9N9B4G5_9GLOM|nr:829_t:CDS:2 [Paraglomus occultum]
MTTAYSNRAQTIFQRSMDPIHYNANNCTEQSYRRQANQFLKTNNIINKDENDSGSIVASCWCSHLCMGNVLDNETTSSSHRKPGCDHGADYQRHVSSKSIKCTVCQNIHGDPADVTPFGISEDECRRRYLFGTCNGCHRGRTDYQYCHRCHMEDVERLFSDED